MEPKSFDIITMVCRERMKKEERWFQYRLAADNDAITWCRENCSSEWYLHSPKAIPFEKREMVIAFTDKRDAALFKLFIGV